MAFHASLAKVFFRRRHGIVLCLILVVHAILLCYSAAIHSPVADEPAHVAAGLSHWKFGEFALYRVNPPLVRMVATAPLLLTDIKTDWSRYYEDSAGRGEHTVGDDLVAANGANIFRYVTIARWACIPFSILGAMVCCWWAKLLFGRLAGLTAAALWCFSPTILGHGSLLTPDVAGTALGLASCYLFSRWLTAPRWGQVLLVGAAFGLAQIAKATWIILFPAFVAIWLVFPLVSRRWQYKATALQLAAILFIGWAFLAVAYGGQGVGSPLGNLPLQSNLCRKLFGTSGANGDYAVRPWLRLIPMPVPRDYLMGIDQQYRDLEGPDRSYLRGVWRSEGWWYYYAYGLAVKEPLGALALAALSGVHWLGLLIHRPPARRMSRTRLLCLQASWLMLLCPATVFVVASINTGMNHHVRYVMPVVPYVYLFAAGLVTRFGPWFVPRAVVSGLLLVWVIASSLLVYPHSLSYFNELAGGPSGGLYHLSSSNIDWGQDLLLLSDWKRHHAPDEKIFLAYLGRVNPAYADIDFEVPPLAGDGRGVDQQEVPLTPGWYAVSVTFVQGRAYHIQSPEGRWMATRENEFSYFGTRTPVARAGYSIYIYRIESGEPEINRTKRNSR